MGIKGSTRLIGILGNPVHHSLSPAMHNAAFSHYDLDLAYLPLKVEGKDLPIAVEALRAFDFRGANVTLPHKQAVIPLLDEVSDLSLSIGAVNTIVNDKGRLIGTTTDPIGFREGFLTSGLTFKDKHIAILGNGGSARTIAFTLALPDTCAGIGLVARDLQKSLALADEIEAKTAQKVRCLDILDYAAHAHTFQIVVNTTPLGMYPNIDASPLEEEVLKSGQVVYDIVYTPERTELIQRAHRKKLNTVGGLGMLVYQGAASFKIWTGMDCDPRLLYRTVRKSLRDNLLARKEPS
jgi:shikimate dehydrogenase